MSKRKYEATEEDDVLVKDKKHTLDSDEEDSDEYEMDEEANEYVAGEEEGVALVRDNVKITPFNMREELEEGEFDKDGQYHEHKQNQIRDNWLDNIDWIRVSENAGEKKDDADDDVAPKACDVAALYQQILTFMTPNETVSQTLRRLGRTTAKMSTIERIRRKKQGIIDDDSSKVTTITELANQILTTGKMDVYEMSYKEIEGKIAASQLKAGNQDEKEKDGASCSNTKDKSKSSDTESDELLWEFKKNESDAKTEGPFRTEQMLKFSEKGKFKNGVLVRKVGESGNFYTSNRIDFSLYL